jgi:hypothetical protein
MAKLIKVFYPIKGDFLSVDSGKPDLYGPFWIYTTLISAIAASGNAFAYL